MKRKIENIFVLYLLFGLVLSLLVRIIGSHSALLVSILDVLWQAYFIDILVFMGIYLYRLVRAPIKLIRKICYALLIIFAGALVIPFFHFFGFQAKIFNKRKLYVEVNSQEDPYILLMVLWFLLFLALTIFYYVPDHRADWGQEAAPLSLFTDRLLKGLALYAWVMGFVFWRMAVKNLKAGLVSIQLYVVSWILFEVTAVCAAVVPAFKAVVPTVSLAWFFLAGLGFLITYPRKQSQRACEVSR